MKTIRAKIGSTTPPIAIGSGALGRLKSELDRAAIGRKLFVIYDANLYALHGRSIRKAVGRPSADVREFVLPSGERYKTARTLAGLYDFLLTETIARDDFVLACGGGVTSDLAGYAAATTLRGVRWGIVSTTLLGMVDAAIGGKTGVNHAAGKNLIGAFWQPSFVISDTDLLNTLPEREMVCGLGEVVKTVGLAGRIEVARLENYLRGKQGRSQSQLTDLAAACAAYKANVVARDEREGGFRRVLNFGHTFAHGIEKSLGYGRLRHGEAVLLGLDAALALGEKLGYLSVGLTGYRKLVRKMIGLVPRRGIDASAALEAMALDKKRSDADQKYVILKGLGKPAVCGNVDRRLVRASLNEALKTYGDNG
jgi:3-dehydroquinate synthase